MTFTEDLLEFLEATQPETEVDLEEAIAKATAQFGARVKANKRVGKKLSPSKYLKKYGASWQNLKNETELEGDALQEKEVYTVKPVFDYGAEHARTKTFARLASAKRHQEKEKARYTPQDDSAIKVVKSDSKKTPVGSGPDSFEKARKKALTSSRGKRLLGKARKAAMKDFYGEEVEHLDELKADTYGRYIKKAAWAAGDSAAASAINDMKPSSGSETKKGTRAKELKRHAGISKAVHLLTKKVSEEVEPLEEISKETGERAYSARMDKVRHHRSLAASKARSLLRPAMDPDVKVNRLIARGHERKANRTLWHMANKYSQEKNKVSEEVEPIAEVSDRARILQGALKTIHKKPGNTMSAKEKALQKKTHDAHLTDDDYNAPASYGKKTRKGGIVNKKEFRSTNEEVKLSKGTKKDKRPEPVAKALPTMPAGMNAGMRMMPEEVLAEISRDKVYSAYKERYALAKAHDTLGNKKEAQKNATKALKHADYHANHPDDRVKYAKVATARAVIAQRAKKEAPAKKETAPETNRLTNAPETKAPKKRAAKKVTEETLTEISKKLHDKAKANRAAREAAAEAERREAEREEWSNMTLAQKREAMGGEYGGDGRDD